MSGTAIVVMGVQGTGKSTVGEKLAARLSVPFIDGDDLHPQRNVDLMAAGTPLTDTDREPWLHLVGEALADHADSGGLVIVCSALRRRYRELILGHAPDAYFVETWGPIGLIAERVGARDHQYMPATLLQSQFDTLEPLAADEPGIRVSVVATPDEIVETALAAYRDAR